MNQKTLLKTCRLCHKDFKTYLHSIKQTVCNNPKCRTGLLMEQNERTSERRKKSGYYKVYHYKHIVTDPKKMAMRRKRALSYFYAHRDDPEFKRRQKIHAKRYQLKKKTQLRKLRLLANK